MRHALSLNRSRRGTAAEACAPDIQLCLSTSSLMLPEMVDSIVAHGVEHVTLTINMVDPEVGARIHPWIFWQQRRVTGIEAAAILHRQQMRGLCAKMFPRAHALRACPALKLWSIERRSHVMALAAAPN